MKYFQAVEENRLMVLGVHSCLKSCINYLVSYNLSPNMINLWSLISMKFLVYICVDTIG